jgi:choline kinase
MLEIEGRPILERSVARLQACGVIQLTVIVGFKPDRIREFLSGFESALDIRYAENRDFATTEHGYSLYCARESWAESRLPVLMMDADNVFDPALLDRLLAAPEEDCVLVDPDLDTSNQDEELVLGDRGRVSGFVRGRAGHFVDCVGGFVGMNRFSAAYVDSLFSYMETLFSREGRGFKYERVFDRLLKDTGVGPAYLDTAGLGWVNVNHPQDLERAQELVGNF